MKNRLALLALLPLLFCACGDAAKESGRTLDNPLFAFNNTFHKPGYTAPDCAGQAALLKQNGFAGIEHRETDGLTDLVACMKKSDLRVFTDYLGIDIDAQEPYLPAWKEVIPQLAGTDMILWAHVHSARYAPSDEAADDRVVAVLRELADQAAPYGVRVALYPHAGFLVEKAADADRLARKTQRDNVGSVFNLCHFLKTEPDEEIAAVVKGMLPKLFAVSICGADGGEGTTTMAWDHLIRPLDEGTFETYRLVELLAEQGYAGPFGLQCYALPGTPEAYLPRSGKAWEGFRERYAQPLNTLTSEEQRDGWALLFDGATTAGWRGVNRDTFPGSGWRIADGTLIADVGGGGESSDAGDIVTEKQYGKFILKWEWNMQTKGGNSGVKYYVIEGLGRNKGYGFGLEYQLLDDKYHEWMLTGRMQPNDYHTLGSLYELYAASPDKRPNPRGLWNESMIVSDGAKVEHWLNGDLILTYDRTTEDFKEKIAASKFRDTPGYGVVPEGHILLQDHGSVIAYRNIKIKELN